MARDQRYKAVRALIEKGEITLFNDMFEFIPKTRVATDLGKHNVRFSRLLGRVEKFTLQELFMLARLLELDDRKLLDLAYNQHLQQRKKKRANNK